jgi:hypothetical protein
MYSVMAFPKQKQLTLYADLMEEIKARFATINHAANGRTGMGAPFVREFLYLQLRFLCELIALGCLVAHGDIGALQVHKIGRSYSADEILDKMERLRPHFYPIAVRETSVTKLPTGAQNHALEGVNPSPLPKEALIAMYGATHKHLHRGSLKRLLSASAPLDLAINVPEIISQVQKISDLLSHHLIALNEHELMICLLVSPAAQGGCQVATALRPELGLPPIQSGARAGSA